MEQAASILRLRRAIGKRKASEVGLEDNVDDDQVDEAETEAARANHKVRTSRSKMMRNSRSSSPATSKGK